MDEEEVIAMKSVCAPIYQVIGLYVWIKYENIQSELLYVSKDVQRKSEKERQRMWNEWKRTIDTII